jgi:hypothetical protein
LISVGAPCVPAEFRVDDAPRTRFGASKEMARRMSRSQPERSRRSRVKLQLEAAMTIERGTLSIEHITIHSDMSFDDVASALESAVQPIDLTQIEALAIGSAEEIEKIHRRHPAQHFFQARSRRAVAAWPVRAGRRFNMRSEIR